MNEIGEDTMTKKLIMFDIDGTLLDHHNEIPSSTKEAIQLVKEAGHEVAIATGRAPYYIQEIRKALGIDAFVCFNGQYVEINNKIVYKNPMQRELLTELFSDAGKNAHPLVYMGAEAMRSTVEDNEIVESCFASLKIDMTDITMNPQYFNEVEVYQTLLFCEAHEEVAYQQAMRNLDFIRWHKYSTDVLPLGGSKAKGIEQFMMHQGFKKEDVYAFGDNLNDIEMLQFVGHGVAMGNAPDVVKKAAKYVTKDVGEDGIAYGLELVGLL